MILKKTQNSQLDLRAESGIAPDAEDRGHKKEILKKIEELENQKKELLYEIEAETAPAKKVELKSASELVADLSAGGAGVAKKEKFPVAAKLKKEESLKKDIKPALPKIEYETLEFPKGFLWGTATSAYQIEGGIKNDWSEWERSEGRIEKLKKEGKKPEDYVCGSACDSYNRYREDFDLLEKLNNNAFRFGLEWARLEPEEGSWDVGAIEHYRAVLAEAKKRGLITVLTLWHWTSPDWFARAGGWEKKENIEKFLAYADMAVKELGAEVDYWVVLNEPMMFAYGAYISRRHPPQKLSLLKFHKVINNLSFIHNAVYDMIHEHFPKARVGSTNMLNYFEPAYRWNPIEVVMAKFLDYCWNGRIVKKTMKCDFLGMNYYFHDRIVWYPPFRKNLNKWVNEKGWEIFPAGIYHELMYLKRFNKPIIIMENGTADSKDEHRTAFIREHLRYVHRAIGEGADVRGYFHWSLLDNFEWSWGWDPKFGLYAVDRTTFKRTARPSAAVYKEICKTNSLKIEKKKI